MDTASTLAPADTPERRVYVNATVRLDKVAAIGFDMDYTLAPYLHRELERVTFDMAVEALVAKGYPRTVGALTYRSDRGIRGLVVDKIHGNVLKVDRFGYVGRARHGIADLDTAARRALYANRDIDLSSARYQSVDTLYALPEVDLFSQLVALRDASKDQLGGRSYRKIFSDVRSAVDRCHRDGSLKAAVSQDPARFIEVDPELPAALATLRQGGRKLFVVTNSDGTYTDTVLRFLLDGRLEAYPRWADYFDEVVVSARKPKYFEDGTRERVVALPARSSGEALAVHAGGSYRTLHRRLGCTGDQVLFVGDHIYGDVIRAKRASFWRTVMIVPELADELDGYRQARKQLASFQKKHAQLEQADREQAAREGAAARGEAGTQAGRGATRLTQRARALRHLERDIDDTVHPIWGALMADGGEVSRFGAQVLKYADLYTTRVPNLARYSAGCTFQAPWAALPHHRGL